MIKKFSETTSRKKEKMFFDFLEYLADFLSVFLFMMQARVSKNDLLRAKPHDCMTERSYVKACENKTEKYAEVIYLIQLSSTEPSINNTNTKNNC